jgi:hypothetical protein
LSIAERNSDFARRLKDIAPDRNSFQRGDRILYRDRFDIGWKKRNHPAEFPLANEASSSCAEASAEDTVEGCGRAAALKMSENDDARFLAGAFGDCRGNLCLPAAARVRLPWRREMTAIRLWGRRLRQRQQY